MSEASRSDHIRGAFARSAAFYALPGALLGATIFGLAEIGGRDESWRAAAVIGLLGLGSGWLFTEARGKSASAALFALVQGAVLGGLSLWAAHLSVGLQAPSGDRLSVWFVANALIAMIAIAFFRTTVERGLSPTTYPSLFEIAWNTHVIGIAAGVFAFLAWGMTGLAAGLLATIGVDAPGRIVSSPGFAWPFWFAAFATAVAVIRDQEKLVVALRGVVFILIRLIGPILLAATLIFLPLFAVKGFSAFDDNTSPTALLLSIAAVGVIHLNAILGDGADGGPLRLPSAIILRVQGVALAALLGIAATAVWIRANEYGLTPERVAAIVVTGVAAAYALIYGVLSLAPKGPDVIRPVNIALAGFAALVAALIQTPLIQPERLSVDSQVRRLVSGASTSPLADLAAIHLSMGKPGAAALDRLEAQAREDQDAQRLAEIERARQVGNRWEVEGLWTGGASAVVTQTPREILTQFVVVSPAGLPVPDDFIDQMDEGRRIYADPNNARDGLANHAFDDCFTYPDGRCTLLVLAEPGEAKPTIHRFDMFAEDGAIGRLTWRWDGTNWETETGFAYGPGEPMGAARTAFFDALAEGRVEETALALPALRFGDGTLFVDEDIYRALTKAHQQAEKP